MDLKSEREVENTQRKLARLEALYAAIGTESDGDEELRHIEMESLMHYINQFKDQIARYEAHQAVHP